MATEHSPPTSTDQLKAPTWVLLVSLVLRSRTARNASLSSRAHRRWPTTVTGLPRRSPLSLWAAVGPGWEPAAGGLSTS